MSGKAKTTAELSHAFASLARKAALRAWRYFRSLPRFYQFLISIPVICGITLWLLIGHMGLALMGTAYALNSIWVGIVGGGILTLLTKAGVNFAQSRWATGSKRKVRTGSE